MGTSTLDEDAINTAPSSSVVSRSIISRPLSNVAAGELPTLPNDVVACWSNETFNELLTPFLPLMTRLQSLRHTNATPHLLHGSTVLDATLLRVEKASKCRPYAQVLADFTPSQLQATIIPKAMAAFRRFERGSTTERVMIVLCEWLLASPGSLDSSELFMNELYQEEVAAILVQALANPELLTCGNLIQNSSRIKLIVSRALAVPVGPLLLSRLTVNDPSRVEQLMDAIVSVIIETTTINKTMSQQEREALNSTTFVMENARRASEHVAKLSPLYAARLIEKLSKVTASLQCAAVAFQILTTCLSREDMSMFLFQWIKRDGAPGTALRTYIQLSTRDVTPDSVSDFQSTVIDNLKRIRSALLETTNVAMYELTTALSVCLALQVLDSFQLTEHERLYLLQSLIIIASNSSSSRAIRLAFLVIILLWHPLAPALSKAPGQRDEHINTAVTLSQQVVVSLFQACKASAGPLFVVSAVLFYTKGPALVPFLASVIGLDGDLGASSGIQVQQALRAEYLYVFGDVVLKPTLTENLLTREVLNFPPIVRASTVNALSSGHGEHELTLRGLHGLLCEKSFLRHHHGHRLESWLNTQVGEQAVLPVHPLLLSVLLEWIENYVMAFEYPIAQAPRRLRLSIVPLRSSTLTTWLSASCLENAYDHRKGHDHELKWARGVLGLTYALQFNQRLRQATMVAGSKLSSLYSASSMAIGAPNLAALGTEADICLNYDLSTFPIRNIITEVAAYADKGRAFEYVAPTLLKLIMEELPHLFDAAPPSVSFGSTLLLLPLASGPHDVQERDLAKSWFRRRRKCNKLLLAPMVWSPTSWTAVQMLLLDLKSAPIHVVMRELVAIVTKFLPHAVVASQALATQREVAAFCYQLASLYATRVRRERGISYPILMRLVQSLCFTDVMWLQQQGQTHQGDSLRLLSYIQVLEEPFRLVIEAHDGVFCQPALLRMLLGIVQDVRVAANVHVSKCGSSLVMGENLNNSAFTNSSVQQHQLVHDCLLTHGLLQRLLAISTDSNSNEVVEECRALLCTLVNELVAADAEASSPNPPRLLLAIHTQGYDVSLVPTLVANVASMKLLWDHWMAATSSSNSFASRTVMLGTKHLMEFVAEGADKDLSRWHFRLRVVLSLCATHLSGSRQSAAMQQALRVVWNKLRNGFGSLGGNTAEYIKLLREVLPWIVDACAANADLSAELVHFLLKLQRQQQSGAGRSKGGDCRRVGNEAARKSQRQRQLLEQVLHDTYALLLEQI